MCVGTRLDRWAVVCTQRDMPNVQAFVDTMHKVSAGLNVQLQKAKYFTIPDQRIGSYIQTLQDVVSKSPDFVFVAIPNSNMSDLYAAIKKLLCVDNAIPSQVITGNKIFNKVNCIHV